MSHWEKYPTQFVFQQELVEALEEMFGAGNVEVHEKAVTITGYTQRMQNKANVVVRARHTGSYDLGFVFEDGAYRLIKESMMNLDVRKMVRTYGERVVNNRLPRGQYRVLEKDENHIRVQELRVRG